MDEVFWGDRVTGGSLALIELDREHHQTGASSAGVSGLQPRRNGRLMLRSFSQQSLR